MPKVTPLGRPGFRGILASTGRPRRGLREAENKVGQADFCRQECRWRAKKPACSVGSPQERNAHRVKPPTMRSFRAITNRKCHDGGGG